MAAIESVIAEQPSYDSWRVWAVLRCQTMAEGRIPWNRKRVYRVMKAHKMLLTRHTGGVARRHDDDKVRVAFALDFSDRAAIGFVATTGGIGG